MTPPQRCQEANKQIGRAQLQANANYFVQGVPANSTTCATSALRAPIDVETLRKAASLATIALALSAQHGRRKWQDAVPNPMAQTLYTTSLVRGVIPH
jgi:hypothetical protein